MLFLPKKIGVLDGERKVLIKGLNVLGEENCTKKLIKS